MDLANPSYRPHSARFLRKSLRELALLALLLVAPSQVSAEPSERVVSPSEFQFVTSRSGPTNYYKVLSEGAQSFVRSSYAPPMKTAVLGFEVPESARASARKLRWTWRAQALPRSGDECTRSKADSAAVVYVTWKRGLKWYTLKYVWSSVGAKGKICDRKRNPFLAQDTVIVESGGPLASWRSMELDLKQEFRAHFDPSDGDVPDLVGIGLMSDGDQTQSPSSADFGAFTLQY